MTHKHALVIGGTGMLAEASKWVAESGYIVSVIGRNKKKQEKLKNMVTYRDAVNSLMVDYENLRELETELAASMKAYGPINLVICWCSFEPAIQLINTLVSEKIDKWTMYHVKGSRRYFNDEKRSFASNCSYHSIYLGFVLEENTSRWLTHDEISDGVIKGIKSQDKNFIVGMLHPWERRPSY